MTPSPRPVWLLSALTLGVLACTCGGIVPAGLGGVRGSGNVITREEAVTGFDQVAVSDGFTVDMRQGDEFRVLLRVDDNLLDQVDVVREGSTLRIGLRPSTGLGVQNATLEADVTLPQLARLDLSGGSHATLSDFTSAGDLAVELSGGSVLEGRIESGDVRLDASGGSHATLSGSGAGLTVDASGGSQVRLAEFEVVNAELNASGGSHVTVNVSGALDAYASGGSEIWYLGSPTLGTTDAEGASRIGPQ